MLIFSSEAECVTKNRGTAAREADDPATKRLIAQIRLAKAETGWRLVEFNTPKPLYIMGHSKEELRAVALDLIFGRVQPPPTVVYGQQRTLAQQVAALLAKRDGRYDPLEEYPGYELPQEDKKLFDEVFWDLVIERVIVPGVDIFAAKGSTYEIRSDADPNTK